MLKYIAFVKAHPIATNVNYAVSEIWELVYQNKAEIIPQIHPTDVEVAVPFALRSVTNSLEWLWDGFNLAQRVVASTLARTDPSSLITQKEIRERLSEIDIQISIKEVNDALHMLQDWDLIERTQEGYRFRVELLRRWIVERKLPTRIQASFEFASIHQENKYNIPEIRKLLKATFSDEEFAIFCYDYFQEVYEKFSLEMTFTFKIQLLIDYCVKRVLLKDLLFQVKTYNPGQYQQFEKYISQVN